MIDGNVIKFGYGTVAVGNSWSDLTLTSIRPPQEIGTLVDLDNKTIEILDDRITLDMSKYYHELKNKLEAVTCSGGFTLAGYFFDFSTYNPKSVEMVLKHATFAYENYIRLCAC